MKIFSTILLLFLFSNVLAQKKEESLGLISKYDGYMWGFENNKKIKLTQYQQLINVDTTNLYDLSKKLNTQVIGIYESPENKALKMQYLNDFPRNFYLFLELYHPSDFKELYHVSFQHLNILEHIVNEYPDSTIELLLSLSKDAYWDADATGQLQQILTDFATTRFTLFFNHFDGLESENKINIANFIADVETISFYKKYILLLDLLNEHKMSENLLLFESAKRDRMKEAH